jgi:curved DNA-binding protein CbpA
MIDYFALLQQPRRPWLEPEGLKEKYHQLTIATHPDRQSPENPSLDFGNVNEAYRVLSDPRLRLQHFLALENVAPNTGAVPETLADVFLETGTFVQEIDRLLARSASNALSKAMMRPEILDKQKLIAEPLEKLKGMYATALQELQVLDLAWIAAGKVPSELSELSSKLAYLTRWIGQLEEQQFRLSIL